MFACVRVCACVCVCLCVYRYTKGDVLLHQDRDCNNVYFLLEGEVDVCVDVPMWPGATHTLTQGGTKGKDTQDSSTGGLTGTQGGDKPKGKRDTVHTSAAHADYACSEHT